MESFSKVHIGFTLLDSCSGHGVVLVAEHFVRDETAKETLFDERQGHRKVGWVLGSGVNDVGVRRLRG